MQWLREVGTELHVRLKAIPNAPKSAVVGVRGGELVLRLNAQPEKGKANRELLDYLAARLGTAKSALRVVSGETARHKIVAVPARLRERLLELGRDSG